MNTARVAPENVNIDTLPYFFQSVITMAMNSMKNNPLVFGVGINDSNYPVTQYTRENGKAKLTWVCPFYRAWKNMLNRCYGSSYQVKRPSYKGCQVCTEWLTFSNFKTWMISQDWRNKNLDKDLLIQGNKIYSPETCIFVDHIVNSFVLDSAKSRGKYPLGVNWNTESRKFLSRCRNPFTGKSDHLGYFEDESEAHLAWKKRKHELACQLAELCSDSRVADNLRQRYAS